MMGIATRNRPDAGSAILWDIMTPSATIAGIVAVTGISVGTAIVQPQGGTASSNHRIPLGVDGTRTAEVTATAEGDPDLTAALGALDHPRVFKRAAADSRAGGGPTTR